MSKVAALTPVACKMLLRLLEIGGENESQDELMEAAGIGSRSQFFKAKQQLKGMGLLDDEGNVNFIVAASVPRRIDPRSFATQSLAAQMPIPPEYELWPPIEEPVIVAGSLRQQAMQADLMPGDGSPTQQGSNYQKRRRQQIAVLAAIFKDLFDYNLTPEKAKELLVASGDSAEEILDAAETTKAQPKEIKFPFGYIKSILKRREQEAVDEEDDSAPPSKDFYLPQPSERTARVTAILAERGLLDDDDDDD